MRTTCNNTCVIVVIQTIAIGIYKGSRTANATWRDVACGCLSFDIIGNAIVVAVEVQPICNAITV